MGNPAPSIIKMSPDRGGHVWWHRVLQELLIAAPMAIGGFYLVKYVLKQMNLDPEADAKERTRLQSEAILRRLDEPQTTKAILSQDPQIPLREQLALSQYEQAILQDLVFPEDTRHIRGYRRHVGHHRRTEGVGDIPLDYAGSLLNIFFITLGAFRGTTVRAAWVWQNHACQSIGSRKRCMFYQSTHLDLD